MVSDLSLSRALGGLRIANPDDAPPEHTLERSPMPLNSATGHPDASSHFPTRDKPLMSTEPEKMPINASIGHYALSPAQRAMPSLQLVHDNGESNSESKGSSLTTIAGKALEATPNSLLCDSTIRPRPGISVPWTSENFVRSEGIPPGYNERQPTTNAAHSSKQDNTQLPATTNTSLPPSSDSLHLRRSSRGRVETEHSSSSRAHNYQRSQNPDTFVPISTQEWQERGAAVGIRREIDANGQTVLRHVKKGVRDFTFGRVLGEGSYSTVYLATDRQTLKEYAIKVLEKKHIIKEKKIKYVNIEKNTLNRLTEHPGIVRLYYTFQDETCLYYALDFCSGGELLGALKRTGTFDVECVRFYGAQILDAIEYMHSRGVLHRDLKPENVLLDDHMHIKITDFGTAKMLPDPRASKPHDGRDRGLPERSQLEKDEDGRAPSFVGTAEYVSPELLTSKNSCKASDLWAFGCIMYQLLAGRPPFKAGSEYLTFQKIVGLDYEFPMGFPPAAQDLVERLLVLDPARRLTIEHIRNHEFFDGQQFGKLLWRSKAPRLRPFVPPTQEPRIIQLNGYANTSSPAAGSRQLSHTHQNAQPTPTGASRPSLPIAELPPPTQLDFEWSSVLTRANERILKLGDLLVISAPLPNNGQGKNGDHTEGHKKLSRFFGGSTTKKRQRLVLITSGGRIILAPSGGEEKRAKQEISLLSPDCVWRSQVDAKGQPVWCVDTVSEACQISLLLQYGGA